MSLTLVGIKLCETELAAIDELVRHSGYKSRSGVLRAALRELFNRLNIKGDIRRKMALELLPHPGRRNKRLQAGE